MKMLFQLISYVNSRSIEKPTQSVLLSIFKSCVLSWSTSEIVYIKIKCFVLGKNVALNSQFAPHKCEKSYNMPLGDKIGTCQMAIQKWYLLIVILPSIQKIWAGKEKCKFNELDEPIIYALMARHLISDKISITLLRLKTFFIIFAKISNSKKKIISLRISSKLRLIIKICKFINLQLIINTSSAQQSNDLKWILNFETTMDSAKS